MPSLAGGSPLRELTGREPLPAGAVAGSHDGGLETGSQAAGFAVPRPRRGGVRAALVTIRPRQWIKNALVIAAPGAAGALGRNDVPVRVALACLAFCLLASGTYAVNDVRDMHEDRRHPRKRYRPVAAGELDPGVALMLGAVLMLAGLSLCMVVSPLLAAVGAGYLLLTYSYTVIWRHLVILDLIAIAGGFVLRAIAGGVAAPVELSRWFVLVITFAAVFVAAGKRQAELRRTAGARVQTRRVLRFYSAARLRLILAGSAAGAFLAYCVWALEVPVVHGTAWRLLTIIPFGACLLRYGFLIGRGKGEAPEELLLADRWLAAAGMVWLLVFALSVHAGG